jgi:hypothetical protein
MAGSNDIRPLESLEGRSVSTPDPQSGSFGRFEAWSATFFDRRIYHGATRLEALRAADLEVKNSFVPRAELPSIRGSGGL